jgi:hypothetical protein
VRFWRSPFIAIAAKKGAANSDHGEKMQVIAAASIYAARRLPIPWATRYICPAFAELSAPYSNATKQPQTQRKHPT